MAHSDIARSVSTDQTVIHDILYKMYAFFQ